MYYTKYWDTYNYVKQSFITMTVIALNDNPKQ